MTKTEHTHRIFIHDMCGNVIGSKDARLDTIRRTVRQLHKRHGYGVTYQLETIDGDRPTDSELETWRRAFRP